MEYLTIQIEPLDEVKDTAILEKLKAKIDEIFKEHQENPNPERENKKIIEATAKALAEKHTRESEQ